MEFPGKWRMSDNVLKDLYLWWKVARHIFVVMCFIYEGNWIIMLGIFLNMKNLKWNVMRFQYLHKCWSRIISRAIAPSHLSNTDLWSRCFFQVWGNNLCVFVSQTITHFCWNYQQLFSTTFCVGGIQWKDEPWDYCIL